MSFDNSAKEKFINLRAEGISFDKISKEINISKPTLIKWNKEFQKEIEDLIFLNAQYLLEQYKLTKQRRIELLTRHLSKINEELDRRDYSELSIKDLLSIKQEYENKLNKELEHIKLHTGEMEPSTNVKFVEEVLLNID
jgi:transposase